MIGVTERIKASLPWYLKIVGKIILSRMPLPYGLWSRLDLFRHGTMDDVDVAMAVLAHAMESVGLDRKLAGRSVLELGPGDGLMTALVAHAFGARSVTLLDAGPFARQDIRPYREAIERLRAKGFPLADLSGVETIPRLLELCGAHYLTDGLASAEGLEPGSVDLVFSRAVLEHVRRAEFLPMCRALWRAMAPDGVAFHIVDLRDHLAYGLNNLRFSEGVWESPFMARSGFYTNRIRYTEMLALFRQAGFAVEVIRIERFATLPISRRALHPDFRELPDDDLTIADFDVVLRKHHA